MVRKKINFFFPIHIIFGDLVMIKINPEMNVVLVDYDDQVKCDLNTDNKFWCHADLLVLAVNVSKLVPLA
jgi:hypothetical protein